MTTLVSSEGTLEFGPFERMSQREHANRGGGGGIIISN